MKKVIIINAIVSALFFVVTMLLASHASFWWSDQLAAGYMGGSITMLILLLCGSFDSKKTTPKKELLTIGILVMTFDLLFSALICALLIEWLHAGPFGVIGYLFVNGVCVLIFLNRNRKQREALTE